MTRLASTLGDQVQQPSILGKRGEQIANELNGRYHVANYRNHLFTATRRRGDAAGSCFRCCFGILIDEPGE